MFRYASILVAALYLALVPPLGAANAQDSFRKAEKHFDDAYANGEMRVIAGAGPDVGHLSHAARHLEQAVNAPGGEGWTKAWIFKARVEAALAQNATEENFVEMQTSRDAMIRHYEASILAAMDLIRRYGEDALDEEDIDQLSYQFTNVIGQASYHFGEGIYPKGVELLNAGLEIKELCLDNNEYWLSTKDDALRQLAVPLMGQVYETDDDLFETAMVAWIHAQPEPDEIIGLYQSLEESVDDLAAARLLDLGRRYRSHEFGWLKLEVYVSTRNGARLEHAPLILSAIESDDNWHSGGDAYLRNALVAAYENGYVEALKNEDAAEVRRLFPLIIEHVPVLRRVSDESAKLLGWTCRLFFWHMQFLEREAGRFAESDAPEASAQRDAVLQEMADTSRAGLAYFEEIEPQQYAEPMVLTFLAHGYQSNGDVERAAAFVERLKTLQSGGTLPGPYSAATASESP